MHLDKMTLSDKENNNQTVYIESSSNKNKQSGAKVGGMPEKLKMPSTNPADVGESLKETIQQAMDQSRLTCGLLEAGQVLESCPEEVMLCILPENVKSDITLRIHFTLIEAFCWENDIRLIKVDDVEKVRTFLCGLNEDTVKIEEKRLLEQVDFNCMLIEYPAEECSEAEEDVIEFYKLTSDHSPPPVIHLPD